MKVLQFDFNHFSRSFILSNTANQERKLQMSTPTIQQISQHGSVRAYKPDPIDPEIVAAIVSSGQRAATSSNLQMYSIVVITDPAERARMQAFCGGQQHISQAPVFLTWCADLSRLERICHRQGSEQRAGYVENYTLAVVDTAIAAQNAALAAESLGLGTCYIGAIRNSPREVIEMLDLPPLVFPLVGMTMGWPLKPPTVRPRLPLDAILHWDRYNPAEESVRLADYDREMTATGIYAGRQVGPDDPVPQADYGWQEHSARRVSQVLRPHLREVLLEQGFTLD